MTDEYRTVPRRSWRLTALVALVGVIAGLILASWGLKSAPALRRSLFGEPVPNLPQQITRYTPPATQPSLPAIPDAGLAMRLADIEARMARVESEAGSSGDSSRAEGLLIAFAARRALDKGMALGYVEGQLNQHFGVRQPRAVAMIIAAARHPVTLEKLNTDLAAIGPTLVGGGTSEGWWENAQRALSGLFIVRRDGEASPDPAKRLARAQGLITIGRVDQALAEVARLPNRAAADNWVAAARRHVEAYRALDLLEAAAIMQDEAPAAAQTPVLQPPVSDDRVRPDAETF